jgi:hypothetical protein
VENRNSVPPSSYSDSSKEHELIKGTRRILSVVLPGCESWTVAQSELKRENERESEDSSEWRGQ